MKKNFVVSILVCLALFLALGAPSAFAGDVNLEVRDSNNNPLAGVNVYYNDYGNHYVLLGTTDDGTSNNPVVATLPDGNYKFKAVLNHTEQINDNMPVPGTVNFQTSKFIVHVKDSDSNNFPEIAASFNDYGNHYLSMGNTDANGLASIELFAGTRVFRANKDHTDATGDLTVNTAGASGTVEFQTAKVIGVVKDCDGTPLSGFKVSFNDYGNHWLTMGITGPDGKASIDLFPGTRKIQASIDYTSEEKDLVLTITESTVEFNPTKVNFQFQGTVRYNDYGNHWKTMTSPFYLFAGSYDFRFDDQTINDVNISGCLAEKNAVIIKLLDSGGNGLAGGVAQYNLGGWQTAGTTNTNGEVFVLIDGLQNTLAFRMYWEDTYIQKNQNVSADPTVVFQTVLVQMELHSSLGAQLTGEGQVNSGSWKTLGNTPTAGKELLPKTYAFRIYYEDTYIQKNQDVSNGNTLVVFETVLVQMELHASDHITQLTGEGQVNSGSWKTMGMTPTASNDGGKELLPKTYAFRIYYEDTYIQKNQDVSNGNILVVFETVLVQMELHASDHITQLTGEGQVNSGSWKTMGMTPTASNNGGKELLPKTYAFRIYYEDTYIQKNQDVASDQLVVFETVLVQMQLLASDHTTQLEGEGKVNSGTWKSMGLTPTASHDGGKELLPKTYAFRIYYEDTYIQKNQDVASDQLVVFETVLVTMRLLDSENNDLVGEGQVNSGSWKPLGNTPTAGKELLPKTYAFRVYYEGTYIQMNQNVDTDPVVIFRGTAVTIQFTGNIEYNSGGWKPFTNPTTLLPKTYAFRFSESGYPTVQKNIQVTGTEMELSIAYIMLLKSDGNGIPGGEGQYNLSGWQSAGTTNSQGVALAVIDGLQNTLAFRMYYEDTYIQKNQNIASNSFVTFQTMLVKMELHSSSGAQLAGEGKVNSGTWKTLGNTPTAGMELLPATYAFRIYYEDTYIQKNQNVATDPLVVFETVQVKMELHSSLGATLIGEGQVNSGSWKTLGNTPTAGKELLPTTYAFRIYYEDTYIQKNQNVAGDPLVIFETVLVKMELHSSSGADLTGEGQVNSGTWKMLGNTPTAGMELLPATYAFRIYYEDTYIQKSQNIANEQLVVFETVLVTMRLLDGSNNELGGAAQVNSGTWKTFGDGTTETTMQLLPQTYAFKITYSGASKQKNQNVASDQTVTFTYIGGILAKTAMENDGWVFEEGAAVAAAEEFKLYGNFPNPFNPTTLIVFTVKESGPASLTVYNVLGQKVATVFNGYALSGQYYEVVFDASELSSGMYIYRLESGKDVSVKRMMFLK